MCRSVVQFVRVVVRLICFECLLGAVRFKLTVFFCITIISCTQKDYKKCLVFLFPFHFGYQTDNNIFFSQFHFTFFFCCFWNRIELAFVVGSQNVQFFSYDCPMHIK